ncbi:hypothetical protein [Flocculibacter collagenilyticus]|nr:hypothetical protein [Flocculibacter collagenilyticus]
MLDKSASFPLGEGWDYLNGGYILAGLILDEVLGEHHSKYARELIF